MSWRDRRREQAQAEACARWAEAERQAEQQAEAAFASAGTLAGEAMCAAVSSGLREVVVRHEFPPAPQPRPVRVYAEVYNSRGEIWRLQPWELGPGQDYARLNDFPLGWLTGRRADDAELGQAGLAVKFDWPRGA